MTVAGGALLGARCQLAVHHALEHHGEQHEAHADEDVADAGDARDGGIGHRKRCSGDFHDAAHQHHAHGDDQANVVHDVERLEQLVAGEVVLQSEQCGDQEYRVPDHQQVCAPGKGPVISYMDGGTIYDRGLFELLRDLAEEHQIPWQTKEYIAGGNDARAIQRTKAGVRVAAVSAAVRYLHAPASVGSVADFENMLKLTRLFLQRMAQEVRE